MRLNRKTEALIALAASFVLGGIALSLVAFSLPFWLNNSSFV